MKNNAFVFTGFAFLLAIPAVILAASFINMLETGDITTSTALKSDLVFYASSDIKSSFERTSCNLVYTYGSNTTSIGQFLNTTWADLIEKNYTQKVGVNVSLQRSINVYDNATVRRIEIGSVPVVVTDLSTNVVHNLTVGPVISSYNNPPSTPSLLFPISGWTTNGAITLDWSNSTDPEGDNVTYQVQVNTSNYYTTPSYLTVNLSNGLYNWKVEATDGIENLTFADVCASVKRSSWTASWNFTVDTSAPSLNLSFVSGYPCKKPGSDKKVKVKANVTTQTGSPITSATVTVELWLGGVLQETGTLTDISGGIYGKSGGGAWDSSTEYSTGDVVTAVLYALKSGYASDSESATVTTTGSCD